MSSRNEEASGMVIAFLMVGGLIALAGVVVITLLFVGAAALFVLAFAASIHPITIGGHTITPRDGHRFLLRGLVCVILSAIPLEILFDAYGISKNWEYIPHCMTIAGAAGALFWEWLRDTSRASPAELPKPPAPTELPRQVPPPAPFEFASWDDEEKRQ